MTGFFIIVYNNIYCKIEYLNKPNILSYLSILRLYYYIIIKGRLKIYLGPLVKDSTYLFHLPHLGHYYIIYLLVFPDWLEIAR